MFLNSRSSLAVLTQCVLHDWSHTSGDKEEMNKVNAVELARGQSVESFTRLIKAIM